MVQVNGICRPLTQRLSRDFAGRVKYSTLCPSRSVSPSEARRAMPTKRGLSGSGSKGREDILIRLLFAYNMLTGAACQDGVWGMTRIPMEFTGPVLRAI